MLRHNYWQKGQCGAKISPGNPPDLDLGPNICRAILTISFHAKPTRPNKSAEQISIKNGTGMHRELWILSSAVHPLKHHGVTQLQTEIFLGSPSDNQQTMNPKGMEKNSFQGHKNGALQKSDKKLHGNPVGTRIFSTYLRLQMIWPKKIPACSAFGRISQEGERKTTFFRSLS